MEGAEMVRERTQQTGRREDAREVCLSADHESAGGGTGTVEDGGGGTTVVVKTKPCRPRLDRMPPWKVLLHNDTKNEVGYVVETIIELTALDPHAALIKMVEAHKTGVALLITVHREHAELLQEQFASKGLLTTIEPDR